MRERETGRGYILLGLLAFLGLGIEVLLIVVESFLYGCQMKEWSTVQNVIHWIITCISWGIVASLLCQYSLKKYGFNIFEKRKNPKVWQWIGIMMCVMFSFTMSYIDWDGFKVIKEFQNKGITNFIFQYIYYAFEAVLFMLIIAFIQKAFEIWTKRKYVPFGGIACAVTWGLGHVFTKGSVSTGLLTAILGFTFGVVYLLVNKDIRKAYMILFIMFVL